MARRQSVESSPRQTHLVPVIFIGMGILLIASTAGSRLYIARPVLPGKLVVKEGLLTWRSPEDGTFRPLSVEETKTTFELHNVGGQAVRILEYTTSCGCATPRVQPTTIPAGRRGIVEVQSTAFPTGEKMATVKLRTDSEASPEVVLNLRLIAAAVHRTFSRPSVI